MINLTRCFITHLISLEGVAEINHLATFFNITQSEVLDTLKRLRDEGLKIDLTEENKAILLDYTNDLTASLLSFYDEEKEFNVLLLDEIDSTNNYCKEHYKELSDMTTVCALKQTGGRGRHQRNFFSYDGGLYFSCVIDPACYRNIVFSRDSTFITATCAIALVHAIEEVSGIDCGIKWVNDIYLNGKKISGILAEAISNNGKIEKYIVGIGINVFKTIFPDEIKDTASYLSDIRTCRSDILISFLNEFKMLLTMFNKRWYKKEYERLLFIKGMDVCMHNLTTDEEYNAKVLGVNRKLKLKVEVNGKKRIITDDEVRIKIGANND